MWGAGWARTWEAPPARELGTQSTQRTSPNGRLPSISTGVQPPKTLAAAAPPPEQQPPSSSALVTETKPLGQPLSLLLLLHTKVTAGQVFNIYTPKLPLSLTGVSVYLQEPQLSLYTLVPIMARRSAAV